MKIVVKTYISDDSGDKFFGYGPYVLLQETAKTGSLRKATQTLNMAYPKALSLIKRAESHLGCKLIVTTTGGKGGGGSALTEEALEVMAQYDQLRQEIDRFAKQRFGEIFGAGAEETPDYHRQ